MIDLPDKIAGFRSKSINALIDFCRSLQPIRSQSIRHKWTDNGISYELPDRVEPEFDYDQFRLDLKSTLKITVKAGRYTAQGSITPFTKADTDIAGPGDDSAGFAAAFLASKKYYVWLGLNNQLTPTQLKIYCGDTIPTETEFYSLACVLGEFTTNAQKHIIPSSVIRYLIGNVSKIVAIPDSASTTTPHNNSIQRNPTTKEEQDYNWHAAEDSTPAADELFSYRKKIIGTPDTWTKAYATADSIATAFTGGAGGSIDTILTAILLLGLKHTSLDFTESGTIGTGKNSGNVDHDAEYWHCYNDAIGGAHANYVDGKEFRTTGKLWGSEVHVSPNGTSTDLQYWTASAILASVSGAVAITSGTTFDITATNGKITITSTASGIDMVAANSSLWLFSDDLKIETDTNDTGTLALGSLAKLWQQLSFYGQSAQCIGDDTGNLVLGNATGFGFANIYYNGNAGIDQASAVIGKITTTKGGVTGLTTISSPLSGTYSLIGMTSLVVEDGHVTGLS